MATPTVYEDVAAGADVNGILFAGKKFWVAQRVPMRTTLLNNIRNNGGQVVQIDKQADYMIADHFRPKLCPPGSISYTFIDQSLKDGALPDPAQHRAGPPLGESREAGSQMRPAKATRVPYTAEEDRILYEWVQDCLESGGGSKGTESGNQIYKEFEKKYPQHTWQSYRDHYLKKLKHNPPPPSRQPAQPAAKSSTEPATKQPNGETKNSMIASKTTSTKAATTKGSAAPKRKKADPLDALRALFDDEDYDKVYAATEVILERKEGDGEKKYVQSWTDLAATTDQTAEDWMAFFEKIVLPQWQKDSPSKRRSIQERVFGDEDEDKEEISTEEQESVKAEREGKEAAQPSTPKRNTAKTNGNTSKRRDSTVFEAYLERFRKERKGLEAAKAHIFWARDENGARKLAIWGDHPNMTQAELHQMLRPIWQGLSDAEKQKYHIMEDADKRREELEQLQQEQPEDVDAADASKQQQPQQPPLPQQQTAEVPEQVETSSTVAQETPDYITKAHTNLMKRIHDDSDPFSKDHETSRDTKRRKRNSSSPVARQTTKQANVLGSQHEPLAIFSAISASSDMHYEEPRDHDADFEAMIQAQLDKDADNEEEGEEEQATDGANKPTPIIKVHDARLEDPEVVIKQELEDPKPDSIIPPDTPPRSQQQQRKAPAFDTQAIFDSESQDLPLQPLPPPPPPPQTQGEKSPRDRSPSVASSASSGDVDISALPPPPISPSQQKETPPEQQHKPSPIPIPSHDETSQEERDRTPQQQVDATTHEHSQSLQNESPTLIPLSTLKPEPPAATKPSQSEQEEEGDEDDDPDPPLHPTEFPEFDAEQYAHGFTYAQIRAALKMTGCRPVLAVRVLDAWKAKEPVPDEKGVWTEQDDKDLYGNDGEALERVAAKHGMDGWGGFEERMDFLERLRRRTGARPGGQ